MSGPSSPSMPTTNKCKQEAPGHEGGSKAKQHVGPRDHECGSSDRQRRLKDFLSRFKSSAARPQPSPAGLCRGRHVNQLNERAVVFRHSERRGLQVRVVELKANLTTPGAAIAADQYFLPGPEMFTRGPQSLEFETLRSVWRSRLRD